MSKVDFKKDWKHLYNPPKDEFAVIDVPSMKFLMVDGHGDPNTAQEYKNAVETLYGLSYKIKFLSRKQMDKDYVVPPLEGLWWAEDMNAFTVNRDKSVWDWTMMIMQPGWITPDMVDEVSGELEKKGLPSLKKVRFEAYHEGLSAQIMHIGSYDEEGPTLIRLHNEWMPQNGYQENGKHHEIYLGDPHRVTPEKLKTVLRQPIKKN